MDAKGIPQHTIRKARQAGVLNRFWQWLHPQASAKEVIKGFLHPGSSFPRMVNWYDPGQLLNTAVEVFISKTLGRHADRRSIEAYNRDARFFDFSTTQAAPQPPDQVQHIKRIPFALEQVTSQPEPKELWIDYVSDLGDGFNSTYAVAYLLAQDNLHVPGLAEPINRGHILIFGGDEVYPTANRREYKDRLVNPYQWALKEFPTNAPYLFAIPGNHDWYDSLSSFMEYFGDYERDQFADGGWHVPQNRSYFALKLPHGWWLLGVDFQLQSDLDHWQIKYFEKIVNHYMQPGDRIILCCAEPFWIYEKLSPTLQKEREGSNLYRLIEILKTKQGQTAAAEEDTTPKDKQIVLYLAGDLHHYFRIWGKEEGTGKNKLQITSGGGGAFLHPTHGTLQRAFRSEFYGIKSYPPAWQSWWLGWLNLGFPFFNRRFGWITGILYVLIGWFSFFSKADEHNHFQEIIESPSWHAYANTVSHSPLLSVLLMMALAGFMAFTLTEHTARFFRAVAGLLHGLIHIAAAFFLLRWCVLLSQVLTSDEIESHLLKLGSYLPWQATILSYEGLIKIISSLPGFIITALLLFVSGWIVGSVLMGVYLALSINLFGQHLTGAFSSLKIQDWKNFLRLKINLETGELTVYPIGIRRVPRAWETPGASDGVPIKPEGKAHYQPVNQAGIEVELIEGPIVITPVENHLDRVNVSLTGNTTRVKRSFQWIRRYKL